MDSSDQETASIADNVPAFSVSALAQAYKQTLERAFDRIRVTGELSRVVVAASGHAYWTFKDDRATLSAVCWRNKFAALKARPEEGLEMTATGRLTAYAPRSQVQLVVDQLEIAGVGAILKQLEARREKLRAEGLFDPDRKRPLPYFPLCIGLVTSPTGAVIRDMLHRIQERFPTRVRLWPVRVQGDNAADEVVEGIAGFNRLSPAQGRPDVLIIARGGGSIEDLWAFNEERVVRAAFASEIPLVSAIGHETDYTLLDLVADLRAPTPTAAAEMLTPLRAELVATLHDMEERARQAFGKGLVLRERLLKTPKTPMGRIETHTQRLDEWSLRMLYRLRDRLDTRTTLLARMQPPPPELQINRKRERLDNLKDRYHQLLASHMQRYTRAMQTLGTRLRFPASRIADGHANLTRAGQNLSRAMANNRDRKQKQITSLESVLAALSYRRVLSRGFAVIRDSTGLPISRTGDVSKHFQVEMQDGAFKALRD